MPTYLVSANVQVSIDADNENEASNLVHDWFHGCEPIGVGRCTEDVEIAYVEKTDD